MQINFPAGVTQYLGPTGVAYPCVNGQAVTMSELDAAAALSLAGFSPADAEATALVSSEAATSGTPSQDEVVEPANPSITIVE